jgi:hypothetical protein
MKSLLTIIFFPLLSFCQNKATIKDDNDSLNNKWIKAVINLETRTNFLTSKKFIEMQRQQRGGIALNNKYVEKVQDSVLNTRFQELAFTLSMIINITLSQCGIC